MAVLPYPLAQPTLYEILQSKLPLGQRYKRATDPHSASWAYFNMCILQIKVIVTPKR